MRRLFIPVVLAAVLAVALAVPALADTVTLTDISGLQAAIDGASGPRTIEIVAGTHVLGGNINVNKPDITIQGQGTLATQIQVSGTGDRFSVTGGGCTIQNLEIVKTDKTGVQNIIWINANDVTIQDNEIHGQFVLGDGDVSRAMVVSAGLSGLLIDGNEIYDLRQPAYFSGSLTPAPAGAVSDNHVYNTKGWVIEGGRYDFTNNTWGTGAQANYYDVAILSGCQSAFYTDIVAMGVANNGAVIEDQRPAPAVLNIVHVDAAALTAGTGSPQEPYQTIAPATTRVIAGGTILVAAGTYTEQVAIAKNGVTLQGAGKASTVLQSPATLAVSFSTPSDKKAILTVNGATGVTMRDLTVDGLGRGNANVQFVGVAFWNAGGALLDADITGVRDTPFSGAQHGVSVYAYNNTGGPYGVEVGGVTITDFQKNGMALNGAGLTANVHDCVVTGAGQTTVTAQNGIQIGWGATGSVADCDVTGTYWMGATWTASGLLLMPGSPVTVSGGSLNGCQTSIYFQDFGGSVTDVDIAVPAGGGIGAWGIECYNSQATLAATAGAVGGAEPARPVAQPFEESLAGSSATLGTAASLMTLAVHGGCLTGPGVMGTEGIDVYTAGGGLSVTVEDMEITGWEYGIGAGGPGSPVVDVDHCAITGNLSYGFALYGASGTCTAEYNWWGNAGGPGVGGANPVYGADYTPWLTSGTDLQPGCGFTAPPDNLIAPVPPATCITPAHACVAVPVNITRTTAEHVRGFTVDVQLGGGLVLCGAGIAQGTYLNAIGGTHYEVVDNGGGSYTVDCAILGLPCGATAGTGTLFTVYVGSTGAGTGTVTLTSGALRDCDNADIASSLGPPAEIIIDNLAPTALTALAAAQVKLGNDGDGTTKIDVTWPAVESGATVHVYRADYGFYPEYDDLGGAAPALPVVYPPVAPWALAGSVTSGTTLADEVAWPNRGFWYYVAYVEDACGNVSPVSNMTTGTLNYHLGDVMDGVTTCVGNNVVDMSDISLLGAHYGKSSGDPLYLACLDVGPTTNRSVNALPTTDNKVNFEDLMMFAINFGTVSLTTTPVAAVASDAVWVEGPAKVVAGQTFTASLRLSGSGSLLGLSAALAWNHAIAELVSVEAGELVASQGGVALHGGGGLVDCALLGADRRLAGEGELARVTFRALASGAPQVVVGAVDARDGWNRTVELTGTPPSVVPAVTSLAPAVPNPFRGTTTLSYALAKAGAVELAIYGVDGRKVATLASGEQAAGSYRLVWDGGGLRPGLYYARLATPEGKFTRTLVLVK